jgi:hypothetical protein
VPQESSEGYGVNAWQAFGAAYVRQYAELTVHCILPATLSDLFALRQPCDQSLRRVIYQLGVDVVRVVHDPLWVKLVGLVELV